MFGRKRIAELEARYENALDQITAANLALEHAERMPRLVAVKREGRALTLVFDRNGERFEFETYSTMSSDIKGLMQWANLT